jgi:repressor LexA
MGRKKLLTEQQVLDAINRWQLEKGVPPTIEELRRTLKLGSTRTVLRYLRWLEERGTIERWVGARGLRTLKALGRGTETRPVALVGEVPAGPTMIAEENHEGWIRLPKELLKPTGSRFFLLRIRGDSMNRVKVEGDKIENGDVVLVRQQAVANSGDVVVALVDGEATVKRLVRGPNYTVLKPESTNPKHQPIVVRSGFQVQGVVRRVLKRGSEFLGYVEV